jgi:predicted DCC family thiol-disulfide oxidoreductase YuxK
MGKDGRWTFYYDGDCGLCTGVVRWLSRTDLFDHIAWVPCQTLEQPPRGLSWNDLDRAAYLETGPSRLHEGYYGLRMLALRLLPLMPLAPILWFPGIDCLGVPMYRWVARNRYRPSRCAIRGPAAGPAPQ